MIADVLAEAGVDRRELTARRRRHRARRRSPGCGWGWSPPARSALALGIPVHGVSQPRRGRAARPSPASLADRRREVLVVDRRAAPRGLLGAVPAWSAPGRIEVAGRRPRSPRPRTSPRDRAHRAARVRRRAAGPLLYPDVLARAARRRACSTPTPPSWRGSRWRGAAAGEALGHRAAVPAPARRRAAGRAQAGARMSGQPRRRRASAPLRAGGPRRRSSAWSVELFGAAAWSPESARRRDRRARALVRAARSSGGRARRLRGAVVRRVRRAGDDDRHATSAFQGRGLGRRLLDDAPGPRPDARRGASCCSRCASTTTRRSTCTRASGSSGSACAGRTTSPGTSTRGRCGWTLRQATRSDRR